MKSVRLEAEHDRLSKKIKEDGLEQDKHKMDLYSRQIGEYGIEAMGKLIKMRVLICGMRGLGVEIAKDLVLAGPGAVTIYDPSLVAKSDLGLNFFLTEDDYNQKAKRGMTSAVQLQKLNRLVDVKSVDNLTEELVAAHNCMVVTRMSQADAERWNEFCRARSIGFIRADVLGPAGFVFVDFGNEFLVRDMNGEQPITRIVSHISNDKEAVVTLVPPPDGRRHNLEMSDHDGYVSFEEVEGMGPEINSNSYKIKHVYKKRVDPKTGKETQQFDAYSFSINLDTTKCGKYAGGGRMTQVKKPVKMSFASLKQSVANPGELLFTDGAKFGRAEQLHAGLRALWDFEAEHGRFPSSEGDVGKVISIGKDFPNFDEEVVRRLATYASAEFQPLSAFFGGVVAQEVVKMTGKYTPLKQWLHLDAFEVIPDNSTIDFSIADDRRADLIRIVSKPIADRLLDTKTFLVGCGALGCEFLKNFALLGVACGEQGLVTVTDNDRIEVSNLSRQFLFREENVGQSKSLAASKAAQVMNPKFNVRALETLVAPQTEGTFNDEFWMRQDFITNALDNVKARLYVDSKCVFYEKPLLESGTLGTKCNVQVVLPFKTQSYADGPKDQEDGDAIPMCTLRNFPSEIEHCIEWGRAQFTDLFASSAQEAVNFSRNPQQWIADLRNKTIDSGQSKGKIASAVAKERGPTQAVLTLARMAVANENENSFDKCISDAFVLFHKMFRDKVVSLITSYPENSLDSQGRPFWSGTKRFPRAVETFDINDPNHIGFLISTANLLAVNRGLRTSDDPVPTDHQWRSKDYFTQRIKTMLAPPLVVESVDMSGGGEEEEEKRKSLMTAEQKVQEEEEKDAKLLKEFSDSLDELEKIGAKLSVGSARKIESAEFEKDQDWNFHIDFVTAASNLRAWNYRLKQAPRHQVKMIAGKIIPALATTTAAVCGLVMVEMLKIVQDKPLETFKDSSNSLGINGYFFSEPLLPAKAKDEYDPIEMSQVVCYPSGFSKWNKIRVKCDSSNPTLREFINSFANATECLVLTSLAHPNSNIDGAKGKGMFLYERDAWQAEMKAKYAEALDKSLRELLINVYGPGVIDGDNRSFVVLETGQEDKDGNTVKVSKVVWMF
jgi:ubiquitin-activating enzyme E1